MDFFYSQMKILRKFYHLITSNLNHLSDLPFFPSLNF